jgi:hypothetical protein
MDELLTIVLEVERVLAELGETPFELRKMNKKKDQQQML